MTKKLLSLIMIISLITLQAVKAQQPTPPQSVADEVGYIVRVGDVAPDFTITALRNAGITRNVLIDREGKIIMLTRLFNEEEFNALVNKIDSLLTLP